MFLVDSTPRGPYLDRVTRSPLLSRESGTITRSVGSFRIVLLYPSSYAVAASSLGWQVIYRAFNEHDDVVCERAVLPDDHARVGTLLTLETGQPVGGAHAIAVTLAYEPDVANLFTALSLAGVPALRSERGRSHPPIVLGGPITMSNTLPLAPFCDAIVLGDGEPAIAGLTAALMTGERGDPLWERLAALPGVFVPALHGEAVPDMLLAGTEHLPAVGQTWSPDSELSDMLLMEPARGCPRYCSFCVMRATAQPPRSAPIDRVLPWLETGAPRIGLVGAAVSEYPGIRALLEAAIARGKGVGISSLRADVLDDDFVRLLVAGGYRTMTVASDAPSQALRGKLKKGIRGRHLLHAAELAARNGISVYKLYVIIGLPGEVDADIEELADFALELRAIIPRVALGIAPFVPKLHTPLGDAAFTDMRTVDRRLARLRSRLQGQVELRSVSTKWAWIEYRLSQGGPNAGLAAYAAWKAGGGFADYRRAFEPLDDDPRRALEAAREHGLWAPAGMR